MLLGPKQGESMDQVQGRTRRQGNNRIISLATDQIKIKQLVKQASKKDGCNLGTELKPGGHGIY